MKNYPSIISFSLLYALFIALGACSNDDDKVQPTVKISDGESSYVELNDCDIGGGPMATEFVFSLDIESSAGLNIEGVEFDILWSDGSESQNRFEDDFNLSAGMLDFDWCFRFGTFEWFELDVKVLANDEEIESNFFTIRVEKPDGAN